jgi:sarcosine oxidase
VQRPDRPGLFYGFPALPGALAENPGVKLAHHTPGEQADPEQARRGVEEIELTTLLTSVAPMVRGLSGRRLADRVCLYTMSADGHFVVDRHARHANVVFGCGFSGHGFKFAPVIGEVLGDLATNGVSSLPIGFLGRRCAT